MIKAEEPEVIEAEAFGISTQLVGVKSTAKLPKAQGSFEAWILMVPAAETSPKYAAKEAATS